MRTTWIVLLWLTAGVLCAADSAPAVDKGAAFKSGLYPGDKVASFKCLGVTGPHKGKSLCYI